MATEGDRHDRARVRMYGRVTEDKPFDDLQRLIHDAARMGERPHEGHERMRVALREAVEAHLQTMFCAIDLLSGLERWPPKGAARERFEAEFGLAACVFRGQRFHRVIVKPDELRWISPRLAAKPALHVFLWTGPDGQIWVMHALWRDERRVSDAVFRRVVARIRELRGALAE